MRQWETSRTDHMVENDKCFPRVSKRSTSEKTQNWGYSLYASDEVNLRYVQSKLLKTIALH